MNEWKEFFKQEIENFMSQIHDVWFFLGVIISMAVGLFSLNLAFSDSDKDREMRRPSVEFMDKCHSRKPSSIHITKFYQKSEEIE